MTSTQNRKRGTEPLYRQVERELLRRIHAGELAPGQRLPTEPELATEWGVNRLTIRQAIGELARAGHITVRQGSGTYVAEPQLVIDLDLPRMPSTDADAGSTASVAEYVQQDQTESLLNVVSEDTYVFAAEALRVPGPFVRADTLVRTGNRPFLVCSYWIEARRFPGFTASLGERVALFQILRETYGLHLRHAWRALTATVANQDDAALLEVPPGSPIMLRDGVNIDHENVPTMYLRRRVRGDRIKFTMHYDTT